ncbi:MAG TPA: metal-dependent hydrolase [Terriglobales bacterium]|nr:metal-dependent hydrolase [Terriglobales bacterium]
MDSLTHSLVGVALSRAFFKKRMVYATTAAVIAANLPDLDVVYSWPGIRYLEYHRGLLHSVWMLPVWAVLVALGLRWVARRRGVEVPALWLGFALGVVCVGSHLLLDWSNAYGVRLLAPFNERWFALDWLPLLDPWIYLILLSFLLFPMMLGLITSEVGSKKKNPHRLSAALALLLVLGWVGLRARQHDAALDLLNAPNIAGMYAGQQPNDWSALPNPSTPFDWQAVVDLPRNYLIADVQSPWSEDRGLVTPIRSFIKPPMTSAIGAAEGTRTAGIFLWFARYPYAAEEEQGSDSRVLLSDMRFAQGAVRPTTHVEVILSDSGQVIREGFGWRRP